MGVARLDAYALIALSLYSCAMMCFALPAEIGRAGRLKQLVEERHRRVCVCVCVCRSCEGITLCRRVAKSEEPPPLGTSAQARGKWERAGTR